MPSIKRMDPKQARTLLRRLGTWNESENGPQCWQSSNRPATLSRVLGSARVGINRVWYDAAKADPLLFPLSLHQPWTNDCVNHSNECG
jgi:hypothetical protein